jgi:hypothetical protein
MNKKTIIFILWSLWLLPNPSDARPFYAAHNNSVSCAQCHVNPAGGGIRKITGKFYNSVKTGGHSKHSEQEFYHAVLRQLGYVGEEPDEGRNGLGLMEAYGAINVPVTETPEDNTATNLVASYDIGSFNQGTREVYIKWKTGSRDELPNYVLLGRINLPFGLQADEHRTYTRLQTRTTLNDFYMGSQASGNFFERFHYDFALLNGFQSTPEAEGGGQFSQGNTWGNVTNLRWTPKNQPFFFGTSGLYFDRHSGEPSPWAHSVYGVLSFNRLTEGAFNGAALLESVRAKHWNNTNLNSGLARRFLPSGETALASAVEESTSLGWYFKFRWDLTPRWALLYKYDQLSLDEDYTGDAFQRHGIGFRHMLTSNLYLQARAEKAVTGRNDISKANMAGQDALWFLVHFWL